MRNTFVQLKLLFFSLNAFLIISCSSNDYSFSRNTFPPGLDPLKDEWNYSVNIFVQSKKNSIKKYGHKTVKITVLNSDKKSLLKKYFPFDAATIESEVEWENYDTLKIDLWEIGDKEAKDTYNKKLILNGPKSLRTLMYTFDELNQSFTPVESE